MKQRGWFKNDGTAWWLATGEQPYDNMETQPLVDRCLYLDYVTVPVRPIVYNNGASEDHRRVPSHRFVNKYLFLLTIIRQDGLVSPPLRDAG